MLTIKQVNKAVAAKGVKAELVKGEGYYYFAGDDVEFCYSTSVMVCHLNQLNLGQWLQELTLFVMETDSVRLIKDMKQ